MEESPSSGLGEPPRVAGGGCGEQERSVGLGESESGLEGEGSLSTPLSVMQSESTETKEIGINDMF